MLNKIKRFKRLATLRKRDVSKEISNSSLLETEIVKNKNLINQINNIIDSNKKDKSTKVLNASYFKNNAQLLNTLQGQKEIATNRNNYLLNEQAIIKKKILLNNLKKKKAEEKYIEQESIYFRELEDKIFK